MDLAVAIDHTLGGFVAHSCGAHVMLAGPGSPPECSSNRHVDGSFIDRQHHAPALARSQLARATISIVRTNVRLSSVPMRNSSLDATHAKGIGVAVFERDPAFEIRR